jgi:uncharacterized protein (DUF1697 family)
VRYVAFLRALNVGGRWVKMAALKSHFEALGMAGVATYITSGNVVFDSGARSQPALAKRLEDGLEPLLGFRSEVFLRRADELAAIAARGRRWAEAGGAGTTVHVGFLAAEPAAAQAAAVAALATSVDRFEIDGRELIWTIRGSVHDSQVGGPKLDRALGGRVTFRKAGMLVKLAEALDRLG